jgi:hypothetical protein
MIKDWLLNTFFDGESTITWGNPAIVSNERNLSLATIDADDAVSMAVDVDVSAALSTTDTDDVVAFTATAPVVTKGAWTSDFEASGVIVWPTPAIIGTGPSPRSLSLATTEEDDAVSATIEHLAELSLLLDSTDEDDAISCSIEHEAVAEPESTSGGWSYADLIEYERRRREALEAQEAAERAAAELIRQEREEEARIEAEKRAAELAEARRRLSALTRARQEAEAEAVQAKGRAEQLQREEAHARAFLDMAEEEEAMAVCLTLLLS